MKIRDHGEEEEENTHCWTTTVPGVRNICLKEHSLTEDALYRRSPLASLSPVFPAPRATSPSAPLSSAMSSRRSLGTLTIEEEKDTKIAHHPHRPSQEHVIAGN